MRALAAALIVFANAAAAWELREIDPAAAPKDLFVEPFAPGPGDLPDGKMAELAGGDIVAAWYDGATDRYRHGALGDVIEAGRLVVRTAEGAVLSRDLPRAEVFEDRYPRLADLDGDGLVEVVTIRASQYDGAAIAIFGLRGGDLVELAAAPWIGRPNRWLNIAGIAPYLGGETREIAYVETPHIGGTLFLWRYADGRLALKARLAGFSNHANGARELRLSATGDFDGDGRVDLVLPSDSRRTLRFVRFAETGADVFDEVELPGRVETAILWREGRLIFGLTDGRVVELLR